MSNIKNASTSYFHPNCRGISNKWDSFKKLICELQNDEVSFDFIGISEAFQCKNDDRLKLTGFHDIIYRCRENSNQGGVAMFIKDSIKYKIRDDLSVFIPHVFESLFVEVDRQHDKSTIIGTIYRPNSAPMADIDIFTKTLTDIMDIINTENKLSVIMGDMNIDLLQCQSHIKTNDYLDNLFSNGFIPEITKPTRITSHSATLIDHIYTNKPDFTFSSGIILTDISDHFWIFFHQHQTS